MVKTLLHLHKYHRPLQIHDCTDSYTNHTYSCTQSWQQYMGCTVRTRRCLKTKISKCWYLNVATNVRVSCYNHKKQFYSRTVPTFVSSHTCCASFKAWFNHHARAGAGFDAVNYATIYPTKIKGNFSYAVQIKFNGPVRKPGTPEQRRIANC